MAAYAQGTSVSIAKTKMDIERLLSRKKATDFVCGTPNNTAVIAFRLQGRVIRIAFPMPDLTDPTFTTPTGRKLKETRVAKACEDESKRRWRALLLIVKAKLEAISSGISTVDAEFLANIVVNSEGETIADLAIPQIQRAYERGVNMPRMLGSGS